MTDIVPIHCPHCGFGNSMVEAYEDDYGYWKVGCGACGSHSGALHPNHKPDAKRLVIGSWNRRPEEDRLRQLLSEAEKREMETLTQLSEIAEAAAVDLVEKWKSDLGATVETKAAGAASHIVNDFRGHIEAALIKLERRAALERSEG